jgi:hypothetical protein
MDAETINEVVEETETVEETESVETAALETDAGETTEFAVEAKPDEVDHLWKVAEDALGTVTEKELPGYVKDITPGHIDELPTAAKQIIRDMMLAKQRAEAKAQLAAKDAEDKVAKRLEEVAANERAFARRQAAFAALVDSPEVRKLETQEGELPDPYTAEGMQARIKLETAKVVSSFFEPIQKEAELRSKEAAYLDFVAEHPEMRDQQFKSEVNSLLVERRQAGSPLTTPDAYEIVKGRRAAAEAQLKRNREVAARRASAEKVGRSSAGAAPGNEPIPQSIVKRGAAAVAEYLENNPQALRAVRQQLRG